MSGMLLSCANMPIIKQIGDLLGIVMNAIYFVFDKIGIANIGLCIIVFTIIVKILMTPMTIKQQKTAKLSSLINPEVQAIQKKYAGKRDNDSIMKMNAEVKAVYEKYGTTQMGGCLPLLLQMCLILALYGVVSAIPTHVGAVKDLYMEASDSVYESIDDYDDLNKLNQIMVDNDIEGFEKQENFNKILKAYYDESLENPVDGIYDILSNPYSRQAKGLDSNKDAWNDMEDLKASSSKIIEALGKVSGKDWEKVKKSDLNEYELKLVSEYSAYDDSEYSQITSDIASNYKAMDLKHDEIIDIYRFAGIDLSRSPAQEMEVGIWWALLIPILAAITQWFSTHLSTKNQPNMDGNPMASSMKAMTIMGPLMSLFFCYSFAAGLGLYWVISSVIQIVQQYFVNSYFSKMEVNDIIKSNIEKMNKKREKQGIPPQKITTAANTNVKNIKVNTNNSNTAENTTNTASVSNYKKGGIAAKANRVKEFNEKNNK